MQASLANHRQLVSIAKYSDGTLIIDLEQEIDPRVLEQMQRSVVPTLPDHLVRSFRAHMQAVNQSASREALPALPADLEDYTKQRLADLRQQTTALPI
jgi:hypothetical protein